MNQTFKYKIKTADNEELLNNIIYLYTGLFYKLYNNLELSEDKGFIKECLGLGLDKSMYDYCLVDAKAQYDAKEEIKKEKLLKIEKINEELIKLSKLPALTNKEKYFKKEILNTKIFLNKTLNNNICFGGKALLRKITKLSQREFKSISNIKRLEKYKKEYSNNRKRGIFLWGKAIEGGNRKIDFDLENNKIILKISKSKKIIFELIPFRDRRRADIADKLNDLIKNNLIPITCRITSNYIYLTFDNEIVNNFSFNITEYNTKIKENPDLDKKLIKLEFHKEQLERKLKNKIDGRVCGVDFNPHEIGFSIVDIDTVSGEVEKIIYSGSFDLKYYTKQRNLSKHDRNKYKYELIRIYSHIFNLCKHYKVSYFGVEDLSKITTNINLNSKEFNRITKNCWNRNLQNNYIHSKCDELGIIYNEVNAAYSSFIGNIKYKYYDCISSSIEIGRRGYVKYKNITGNHIYPMVDNEDYKKMYYLIGQDLSNLTTWVSFYKLFKKNDKSGFGGLWRNKIFTVGKYLDSKRSNINICN